GGYYNLGEKIGKFGWSVRKENKVKRIVLLFISIWIAFAAYGGYYNLGEKIGKFGWSVRKENKVKRIVLLFISI
ncbi:hypothetical protein E7X19_26770, partial [Bacteroides fragilis]